MTLSEQERPLFLSGGQILTSAGGSLDLIGWPLPHWWLWMSRPHNASPVFLSDTLKAHSFETFQVWMLKYMVFAIYALFDLEGLFFIFTLDQCTFPIFFPFLNFSQQVFECFPFFPERSLTISFVRASQESGSSCHVLVGLLLAALFQNDSPKLLPTELAAVLKQYNISPPIHWIQSKCLISIFLTEQFNMITCTFCCLLPPAG